MIADIFVTTKDRPELLNRTLNSLRQSTPREQYRLTVVRDGDSTKREMATGMVTDLDDPDYVLINTKNAGLGPSINMALAHIDALRRWDTTPPLVTCYVQDDVDFTLGWLEKLSTKFLQFERPLNLGFASGHNAVEHTVKKDLGNGMLLKDWIRATNMMARHEYWMSMWPISRIDPETGRERGKPNDGMGSSVDWWFIRNHPNSVCKAGKTNLVIPGLVVHSGYKDSTWLKRELPESESDKAVIR